MIMPGPECFLEATRNTPAGTKKKPLCARLHTGRVEIDLLLIWKHSSESRRPNRSSCQQNLLASPTDWTKHTACQHIRARFHDRDEQVQQTVAIVWPTPRCSPASRSNASLWPASIKVRDTLAQKGGEISVRQRPLRIVRQP